MNTFDAIPEKHWPNFRFYRYDLPLTTPLHLKSGTLSVKSGVLIHCERGGYQGWGDIAPLDGYSSDRLAGILDRLPAIRACVREARKLPDSSPAIRSGMEFALAHYLADRDSRSLYLALGGFPERTHLKVARLIIGNAIEAVLEQVTAAVKDGYSCLKIKVGMKSVSEDIEMIQAVRRILPPGVTLRLDANRAWSVEEAIIFSRSIETAGIEYIEEPLACESDYGMYANEQTIPFALDESLAGKMPADMKRYPGLTHVVLKPSVLGGLQATRNWMNWAAENDVSCVMSSAFESGVGINGLIALAGAKAYSTSVGFDTYSYLADDVIRPRIRFQSGRVAIFQSFAKSWEINFDKLDELQ